MSARNFTAKALLVVPLLAFLAGAVGGGWFGMQLAPRLEGEADEHEESPFGVVFVHGTAGIPTSVRVALQEPPVDAPDGTMTRP